MNEKRLRLVISILSVCCGLQLIFGLALFSMYMNLNERHEIVVKHYINLVVGIEKIYNEMTAEKKTETQPSY